MMDSCLCVPGFSVLSLIVPDAAEGSADVTITSRYDDFDERPIQPGVSRLMMMMMTLTMLRKMS